MADVVITSDGEPTSTKVYVGGEDISGQVKSISWSIAANDVSHVTLELVSPVIKMDGEHEVYYDAPLDVLRHVPTQMLTEELARRSAQEVLYT